jgi:cell division protein FtsB
VDFPVILHEKVAPFLRRYSRELIALAFCLILVHDIFGEHGVLAMHRTKKQAEQVRQEIQRLDDENRLLQERVKALKSDPRAIERVAREDMGLARPGELIFKLPPKPNDSAESGQPDTTNPPKK